MGRKFILAFLLITTSSRPAWAIYGPSLIRTDPQIVSQACEDAHFSNSREIAKAVRSQKVSAVLPVLGEALKEWRLTPEKSALYPARAFCIHELVPANLDASADSSDRAKQETPTVEVKRFKNLGIVYSFYEPDGAWLPVEDPVDLNELAAKHLSSRWGRQAFLMMTQLGWSQGACQEGPNQFREVIRRGQEFLARYPKSETSDSVRLEVAKAYSTWWTLSQPATDWTALEAEAYKPGAEEAKVAALRLYQEYLNSQPDPSREVQDRFNLLRQNPAQAKTHDYFCPDYED